jgi:DNA-binding transcriptional MerR regulator
MATTASTPSKSERLLTIGAVCRRLKPEFPDISISKIRYLEDQGLLAPRRTQGGYRLFAEEDVERLQRILELQRDAFLPLRVIREELASESTSARRQRRVALGEPEEEVDLAELCQRAGIAIDLARRLEDFGLLAPRQEGKEPRYAETDVEIAEACGKLARYGVEARHLKPFRNAAERNARLVESVVAPALRSRNPERRRAGVEDLQTLAGLAQELAQLLFWRELRTLTPAEWRST